MGCLRPGLNKLICPVRLRDEPAEARTSSRRILWGGGFTRQAVTALPCCARVCNVAAIWLQNTKTQSCATIVNGPATVRWGKVYCNRQSGCIRRSHRAYILVMSEPRNALTNSARQWQTWRKARPHRVG